MNLKGKGSLVNPLGMIQAVCQMLELSLGLREEADAWSKAIRRTLDPPELVGSDCRTVDLGGKSSANEFMDTLLHNLDYYLEAVNSAETAGEHTVSSPADSAIFLPEDAARRPMGVIEKILTHAGIGLKKPEVQPGDMTCVKVDWTLTSELP
ncbi:hypothetical protein ACHAQH_009678 [Verticillium albo-atrum]